MSLISKALKKAKVLNKDIPVGAIKRTSFFWKFIEGELAKQTSDNLIDLRKLITKILSLRRRSE